MRRADTDSHLLSSALALEPGFERALAEGLEACGGLFGLFRSGAAALRTCLDPEPLARLEAIIALAVRLVAPPSLPDVIEDASAVAAYFRPRLLFLGVESFWVLFLDARGRPTGSVCIAEGTLTACLVHPREVFAPALAARAASIVVVHNHPSGDPVPSPDDEALTERLSASGELLGVPLIDHVIVARGGFRSLGGGLGRSEVLIRREAQAVASPGVIAGPHDSARF